MISTVSTASVKIIGSNGQISLGKQYAGRQVLIEEQEPGVWLVRTASVVPDNERWLHESQAAADLKAALQWSQDHTPDDSQTEAQLERLRGD
jgi:hypothetical protein